MEVVDAVARLSENVVVDNLLVATAIITAIVTVGTLLWKAVRPLKIRVEEFLDWHETFRPQWEGMHGEGPGDIHTPGVMERLSKIDGEFERNGGNSMKDALFRVTRDLESLHFRLDQIDRRIEQLHRDMSKDGPIA